jgi:hypothetical protein
MTELSSKMTLWQTLLNILSLVDRKGVNLCLIES